MVTGCQVKYIAYKHYGDIYTQCLPFRSNAQIPVCSWFAAYVIKNITNIDNVIVSPIQMYSGGGGGGNMV